MRHYTSISAMLVESAALNTGCSLVFLVLYARGNPGSNIFQGLVCYCQITASMLIVLRVVKGQAFSKGTIENTYPMSALEFNSPNRTTTTGKTGTTSSSNPSSLPTGMSLALGKGLGVNTRDIQIQLETATSYDDLSGGSATTSNGRLNLKEKSDEKDSNSDSEKDKESSSQSRSGSVKEFV